MDLRQPASIESPPPLRHYLPSRSTNGYPILFNEIAAEWAIVEVVKVFHCPFRLIIFAAMKNGALFHTLRKAFTAIYLCMFSFHGSDIGRNLSGSVPLH